MPEEGRAMGSDQGRSGSIDGARCKRDRSGSAMRAPPDIARCCQASSDVRQASSDVPGGDCHQAKVSIRPTVRVVGAVVVLPMASSTLLPEARLLPPERDEREPLPEPLPLSCCACWFI